MSGFVYKLSKCICRRFSSYVQGQEPEPTIREYFYYIDHQGMLFLDDARMKNFTSCFKEKKFLHFFFKNLKVNQTGRYTREFPYISLCGRERNFVRCDDYPIVYTHIIKKITSEGDEQSLSYGYTDELLTYEFQPQKLVMLPLTGRVYHPAPAKSGAIGLVRSKLAIELSKHFIFEDGECNPPTQIKWGDIVYDTDREWYKQILRKNEHSQ